MRRPLGQSSPAFCIPKGLPELLLIGAGLSITAACMRVPSPDLTTHLDTHNLESAIQTEVQRKSTQVDLLRIHDISESELDRLLRAQEIADWPTNMDLKRREVMFRRGVEDIRQALTLGRSIKLFDLSTYYGAPGPSESRTFEPGSDLELDEQDTNHTLYRRPLLAPLSWKNEEFGLREVAEHDRSNADACDTERGRRFMLGWAARQGIYPVNSTKRKNP